ncbi:DUF3606 domain-containing protein [Kumtagia ephedrae]|jgi:hypothetical protein|uniref:DUF3606 domain-containing protein n=1 Tax=Kumtagia ephedrae TaxID=2116701 RepID=A0A2P7S2L8_9HYPH|nr:DUF3606 domain-containing protein [Mesorhizobium ephedrae]PSJ56702.1 hypothetical protein C7I84_19525 [Mesorhizobium ephedrae]
MADRQSVAEGLDATEREQAEIRHLAENTDLSPKQAHELVRRHGTDRKKLMEIAKTFKAEG